MTRQVQEGIHYVLGSYLARGNRGVPRAGPTHPSNSLLDIISAFPKIVK